MQIALKLISQANDYCINRYNSSRFGERMISVLRFRALPSGVALVSRGSK